MKDFQGLCLQCKSHLIQGINLSSFSGHTNCLCNIFCYFWHSILEKITSAPEREISWHFVAFSHRACNSPVFKCNGPFIKCQKGLLCQKIYLEIFHLIRQTEQFSHFKELGSTPFANSILFCIWLPKEPKFYSSFGNRWHLFKYTRST